MFIECSDLNVRYNSENDCIQVLFKNEWHNVIRADIGNLYLVEDGKLLEGFALASIYTEAYSYVSTTNNGITAGNSSSASCHFRANISPAINLTPYSRLVFNTTGSKKLALGISKNQMTSYTSTLTNYVPGLGSGSFELDISNYDGDYFIAIGDYDTAVGSSVITGILLK